MAKLVILITARIEEAHDLGAAWQKAGAPGVTFIESYGIRRMQEKSHAGELLPGVLSMLEALRESEETSLIALTVVDNDQLVDQLIAAAERILGDLNEPNNGILFVLDVARTVGVRYHGEEK